MVSCPREHPRSIGWGLFTPFLGARRPSRVQSEADQTSDGVKNHLKCCTISYNSKMNTLGYCIFADRIHEVGKNSPTSICKMSETI